jgi:homoserine dehydrogenase
MRIFVCGMGVVGRAVCELLASRGPELRSRYGVPLTLAGVSDSRAIVLAGSDSAELDPLAVVAAKQAGKLGTMEGAMPAALPPRELAGRCQTLGIDVFVDCSPTDLKAAAVPTERMLAMLALRIGVVSVNKGPLATAMPALLEAARYNQVQLRFSGTVGGGTPVLATGSTLNRGETVTAIRGIVNGTTNFILWKMATERWAFDVALAEAQKLGYAETDPTADVDGWDAAAKVVILANAVLGIRATVQQVSVTGIRGVTPERIASAAAAGKVVKLIAGASAAGLTVAPQEVDAAGPLNTSGSLNAVEFTLSSGAVVAITGRGAGGVETASAVLRDLIDIGTMR